MSRCGANMQLTLKSRVGVSTFWWLVGAGGILCGFYFRDTPFVYAELRGRYGL